MLSPTANEPARRADRGSDAARGPVRVLVVDDEEPILELVRGYLEREGWVVSSASDGNAALSVAAAIQPDAVVLDLMLPGLDGIEVCRRLRTFSNAYVIMLTARSEEVDKLIGLAIGADDYLTKPFSPRELVGRIRAMLRRPRVAMLPGTAALEVDTARRRVVAHGRPVELTRTEFDIVALLARAPGVVVDRPTLLATVWGPGYDDDHLVDVHVANLRRKLGDNPERPRYVETVRGVGYRLVVT